MNNNVQELNNFNDLLKLLVLQGKIDLTSVQQDIAMKSNVKIIEEKHNYKISMGSDGKWRTYIYDPGYPKNRKMVKRNTKEDIIDYLIKYYEDKEDETFHKRFQIWKQRRIQLGVCDNTVLCYDNYYKRYIEGSEIEFKPISKITEDDLIRLFNTNLNKYQLPKKSFNQFYWMISDIFEVSLLQKIITENVCKYVDKKMLSKLCVETSRKLDDRVFSDEELTLLYNELLRYQEENPRYIPTYAVRLAIFTGMRTGELAGLTWNCCDFTKKEITICQSLKKNRKTKEYYMASTKTNKTRIIPMSEQVEQLLLEIKRVEMKYGYITEYVFSNECGRVCGGKITDCCIARAKKAGLKGRGKTIHGLRRTFNSKLRELGMAAPVASSILGHTDEVNKNNYTYDVSQMPYKMRMVSSVNDNFMKMVSNN